MFLHCWGISLVCLALELVGSWVELDFNVGMEPFGEGGVTPLQYSCLENPMDRGAWWAAVYGVSQSQTRLNRLSSSSSSMEPFGRAPID